RGRQCHGGADHGRCAAGLPEEIGRLRERGVVPVVRARVVSNDITTFPRWGRDGALDLAQVVEAHLGGLVVRFLHGVVVTGPVHVGTYDHGQLVEGIARQWARSVSRMVDRGPWRTRRGVGGYRHIVKEAVVSYQQSPQNPA